MNTSLCEVVAADACFPFSHVVWVHVVRLSCSFHRLSVGAMCSALHIIGLEFVASHASVCTYVPLFASVFACGSSCVAAFANCSVNDKYKLSCYQVGSNSRGWCRHRRFLHKVTTDTAVTSLRRSRRTIGEGKSKPQRTQGTGR